MTEYEKMLTGLLFDGKDTEIFSLRHQAAQHLKIINSMGPSHEALPVLAKLVNLGPDSVIIPPFQCEFGKHITIGENSLVNMGATFLDGAPINIGNNVLIGPNCQLYTPTHSLNFHSRQRWEVVCQPITIEDDVWVGGNVIINQGVTIGARSVIAAGSVINRDVAPDSLMAGIPAKPIRSLIPAEAEDFPALSRVQPSCSIRN